MSPPFFGLGPLMVRAADKSGADPAPDAPGFSENF
jgi:hypothetical protein